VSSVSPMAMSNTCLASWTGSRGRLVTKRVSHSPRYDSTGSKFKLIHYLKLKALAATQAQCPAPKGASDLDEIAVSLKRYPDTKPLFFSSF
jgi:hypothetical protein